MRGASERTREERRRRIEQGRDDRKRDKIVFGVIFFGLVLAAQLWVISLEIRNLKSYGGMVLAALVFPSIAMFCLYDPVKRFLLRIFRGPE